jgi:hypothetical protein
LRVKGDLLRLLKLIWVVQSSLQKYFASPVGQIISTNSRHPTPPEGRIAIVTDAGWGAVDAAVSGAQRDAGRVSLVEVRERSNGELTNGTAAYGEVVWS